MGWQAGGEAGGAHLLPESPSDLRHSLSPRPEPSAPQAAPDCGSPGPQEAWPAAPSPTDGVTTLLFLYRAFRLEFRLR